MTKQGLRFTGGLKKSAKRTICRKRRKKLRFWTYTGCSTTKTKKTLLFGKMDARNKMGIHTESGQTMLWSGAKEQICRN